MLRRSIVGRGGLLSTLQHVTRQPVVARSLHAVTFIQPDRKKPPSSSYMLLIIPASAFCLGCWQIKRRQWKLQLIKEMETRIMETPVELPDLLEEVAALEYHTVNIRGTFQHDKEMLYGPRPPLYNGRYKEQGSLVSTGSSGFLVVTPFTLTESGATILVNRGWVSKTQRDTSQRLQGQVSGEQQLTGVVRLPEKRPPFMPKTHDNSIFYLYRDIKGMSAATGSAPVFVDACDGVEGGPMAGQTRVTLRNEHLSYLITWYSLSAMTTFLWYKRFVNPRAWL